MKTLDLRRYRASASAAFTLLAACGVLPFDSAQGRLAQDDMQPPIGPPGAMPQASAIATHADRGTSWILSGEKNKRLLYISDARANDIYVFSYPAGKLVGTLMGFNGPQGICADKKGNIFVTNAADYDLLEFAHGGAKPIRTISEPPPFQPQACAIDSTTGNLAVTNNRAPVDAEFVVGASLSTRRRRAS